jgi:hypothetical protein
VHSCQSGLANFENLAKSLSRLYKRATKTLRDVKCAFDELTDGWDPALVAQWEKESVEAKKNKKGHWESVYQLLGKWEEGILISRFLMFCSDVITIGPCTQGQKFQKLLAKEEKGTSKVGKGDTSFINTGLHLEADMYVSDNIIHFFNSPY